MPECSMLLIDEDLSILNVLSPHLKPRLGGAPLLVLLVAASVFVSTMIG